ncbi:MAG TPA: hypothetical protein VNA24_22270 [Hyalangium sp.]|nr:hypothetical protein [Hyalangium sp.]
MRRWAVAAVAGVLGLALACGDSGQPPPNSTPQPPPESNPLPPPGPSCTPTTCEAQHQSCGVIADGCGGTLTCGEPCTTPAPGPSACAGLLPENVPPKSRDVVTGFRNSCELNPSMDGAGSLAYAGEYVGYGTYRWYVQGPDGTALHTFVSRPTPELWPQAQGFQTVGLVCGGGGSGLGFEAYEETGQSLATASLGNYSGCEGEHVDDAADPAGGTVVAWLPSASGEMSDPNLQLKVQRFDGLGQARFAPVTLASWVKQSTEQLAVVVGTDVLRRTLVLWNGDGSHEAPAAGRRHAPALHRAGTVTACGVPGASASGKPHEVPRRLCSRRQTAAISVPPSRGGESGE